MTTMIGVLAALLAGASPGVVVLPYQTLGTEPAELARMSAALRQQVQTHGWIAVEDADAARQQRAAVMCGEDAECLATLGQRAGVKWVLAFSMGRVGGAVLLSTLLIDTASGKRHSGKEERVPTLPSELAPLAARLVDPLFRDLPMAVALVPPPEPPMVVAPPLVEPPGRTLRPFAIGTAIGAGALAVGGGVLTGLAGAQYGGLKNVAPASRTAADASQRTMNLAADLTVGVAIAAAATSTLLFLLDGPASPAESGE